MNNLNILIKLITEKCASRAIINTFATRNHEGEVLSSEDSLGIAQYLSTWGCSYSATYLFYSSMELLYIASLCLLFSYRCFNTNYSNYPL